MPSTSLRKKTVVHAHQHTTCESLSARHRQHFIDDGWQDSEIRLAVAYGVRSISRQQAKELLGYYPPSGGIWFPFTDDWGQLRPDSRKYSNGDESPKYCSPRGDITGAALWLPPGCALADLAGVTEGWKDAFIATVRTGKPVGAIAGVSHVGKALPLGTKLPLIFDSDGWQNANVMGSLITGGQHLSGKIALIPESAGAKAGFTEFCTSGGQWADLEFYSPAALLGMWMQRLIEHPLELPKHCDDVAALYRKVYRLAKGIEKRPKLLNKKDVQRWESAHTSAWRKAYEAKLRAEQVLSLEAAPVGEFPPLSLPSQRHLFALNGQKGTGKTSIALKSLVNAARAAGLSVLYFVPTQMLSRDAATKLGLTCHLDKDAAAQSNHVMSCGESAHLFRDRRWDVVIVDEVNEVLPRSLQGTLGQNPKAARAALTGQIAAARIVAIAQDGLYRPVLNAVQRLGNFSADQVEIISRRRPQSTATITLFSGDNGYASWAEILLSSAEQGKKQSLPSGSEDELAVLNRWLRQRAPDGLHKKLTGKAKSFSTDRKAFATGPDQWIAATAPTTLGFSPVFNSGVSIEEPYFDQQSEYVAALETATAASQRGERARAAIGGIPRYVFLQTRGMPALPPMEIFGAEYWQALLNKESEIDTPNLKQWGFGDLAAYLDKPESITTDFPELPAVLAIQAREIHFKKECLTAEWESNGWQVIPGPDIDSEAAIALMMERREIKEGVLQSKSRSRSLAPSTSTAESRCPGTLAAYRAKVEAEGPIAAVKYTRWGIEGKIGALDLMDSPEFWAAYHLDSIGEISATQVNALLRLQFNQPDQWAAMQRNAALRAIGGHAVRNAAAEQAASGQRYGLPELPNVPDLAASSRLLATAALLGKCPGIRAAMDGTLGQVDKNSEVLQQAKRWAIANATKLAALSQHSQRWYGLQFTDKTPTVRAFSKLLSMIGRNLQQDGQLNGVWQYRLQSVADVQSKVKQALEAGKNTARLLRESYRAEHREQVITGALDTAIQRHASAADSWAALETFTREHFKGHTELQKEDPNTTEALCGPPEPPKISNSDWLDFAEILKNARLYGSSAVDEVREMLLGIIGPENWRALVRGESTPVALGGAS